MSYKPIQPLVKVISTRPHHLKSKPLQVQWQLLTRIRNQIVPSLAVTLLFQSQTVIKIPSVLFTPDKTRIIVHSIRILIQAGIRAACTPPGLVSACSSRVVYTSRYFIARCFAEIVVQACVALAAAGGFLGCVGARGLVVGDTAVGEVASCRDQWQEENYQEENGGWLKTAHFACFDVVELLDCAGRTVLRFQKSVDWALGIEKSVNWPLVKD